MKANTLHVSGNLFVSRETSIRYKRLYEYRRFSPSSCARRLRASDDDVRSPIDNQLRTLTTPQCVASAVVVFLVLTLLLIFCCIAILCGVRCANLFVTALFRCQALRSNL